MSQRSSERSIAIRIASITAKSLRLAVLTCCWCAFWLVLHAAPYVPTVLRRLALLGTALCVLLELVVGVPDFPFWEAMKLPVVCATLLILNRVVAAASRPAAR